MVEIQLAKSILVLEKLVPGFKLADLDAIMERHDIHVPPPPTPTHDQQQDGASTINPALAAVLNAALGTVSTAAPTIPAPIPPPIMNAPTPIIGNLVKIEHPTPSSSSGAASSSKPQKRPSEGASDSSATVYEDPRRSSATSNNSAQDGPGVKGQDPQSNDLSSTGGLIKAFGVSKAIVKDLPKPGELTRPTILCHTSYLSLHAESRVCVRRTHREGPWRREPT